MADPKPTGKATPKVVDGKTEEEAARVREAIGEGLRKFYDTVADEPIPAEWLALVGAKPEEPSK
jgi:hypothetical protein